MKDYQKICVVFSLIGLLSLTVLAQSGGTFVIEKSVIASGGDRSAGGSFVVRGTIGQAAAGTQSNGGTFSLTSGFWTASANLRGVQIKVDLFVTLYHSE